jgi:soluble lytic murein transglycosylase-like protein
MQLMPATASGLGVTDPYDPAQNVQGGTRLVRSLLDRFGGDQRLALAAYKVGPALVERYGGIPPTGDVQRYIDGILAAMQRYRGGLPLPPSLDVPASDAPAASPSPLPPWLDVPRM